MTTAAAPHPFDRGYWLAHCEGFRVDADGGRLGFVERVEPAEGGIVLAVRAGRFGRRVLLVDAGDVDFIVPRAQRLWLRSPTRIVGTRPEAAAAGPPARALPA
jgi:hypothetical protein